MALACDFRVMAKSAIFRQAYTSNGLSVDGGGTYTLPRLVGLAKAMEILAFDRPIPAEQALTLGLVTEVVEEGRAVNRAMAMIREITKRPLSSFLASKKLLTDSFHTLSNTSLKKSGSFWRGAQITRMDKKESRHSSRKGIRYTIAERLKHRAKSDPMQTPGEGYLSLEANCLT